MVGNVRVLLTDNNDTETTALVTSLYSNDMEACVCSRNGAKLLEYIKEINPDVVIMDAFMDHIDALGVLARMDALCPVKRPLIMVTSSIENKKFQKILLGSGADYYLLKPIRAALIVERIKQMLSEKNTDTITSRQSAQDMAIAVTEILHKVGIPAKHKGFRYLREAILLVIEYPELINQVTTTLYPTIAKVYNSDPHAVERAMRYAISRAWEKGNVAFFKTYFGYAIKNPEKPCNSEFIARVSDDLRFKNKMNMQLDGPYIYEKMF